MTDTHIAKLMWDAYAFRAGGITFDGKPLPTWDELGEDRQSCWVAAASVTADRIKKLEAAMREIIDIHPFKDPEGDVSIKSLVDLVFGINITARKALEGKDD